MNAKTYFSSRKGFTLIELLVVIGILAVLAAIAIPSVAGLIDRANVSSDKTNSNEMTNAVERFTSEYELYCQDIASGAIKDADSNGVPDNMDAAQGRVFNVTGAVTRANITALESTGLDGMQINRDTKYPVNAETMQAIVENYTKTSSATFEPKQSDMHYWYSPDCGVVVYAEPDADQDKENKLNSQVLSGKDAKGNLLGEDTVWIDLTENNANGGSAENQEVGCDILYWDGNTNGKVVVTTGGMSFYKISDCTPALEDVLQGFTGCMDLGNGNSQTIALSTEQIQGMLDAYPVSGDGTMFLDAVFIVPNDNCSYNNTTFPEKGIYAFHAGNRYLSSFKVNGYTNFEHSTNCGH